MKFLALLTLSACAFATEPNDATRRWWSLVAAHPTVPKERMVASINLDQLRPLFPLGIRSQSDLEPDRNPLRRSDHFNFMQLGIPSTGFVFGFDKGSREEGLYREWYSLRYQSPADDFKQPWDPSAAAKFHEFFARLIETIANADERPQWKSTSKFAPRK